MARGSKARHFRERLGALPGNPGLRPTTAAGSARNIAAQAVREGFDVIVAAGGDGTVNEVLNGIADVPDALTTVAFAVLPLGTTNVFAREIGMPRNPDRAWRAIVGGRERSIDLPHVEYSTEAGPCRRHFAQMAGAGWDSLAVDAVDWEIKKRVGGLAYVLAGLGVLRRPLPAVVASDGVTKLNGELVLVGNGQFYGGSYRLFPLADLRDGLLEVTVFPRVNVATLARALAGLACDRMYTLGRARHFKARTLTLSCEAPMPFHVEGENIGLLPARFCIERAALRVIVP